MQSKFLVRIPIGNRDGPYKCHQRVYEVCGGHSRPVWRRCSGYLIALADTAPFGLEVKSYDPQPRLGQVTRFDLFAEVSVSKKKEGATRSSRADPILESRFENKQKKYGELAHDLGGAWLNRQGQRVGFEVLNLERADYEVVEFRKSNTNVRIGAVRFSGQLKVTEPSGFRKAMLEGLGHSKAWGLGMLLCFRT